MEPDHLQQLQPKLFKLKHRLGGRAFRIPQLCRIALHKQIVCLGHIDQREQSCRCYAAGAADGLRTAAGAAGEVDGGERFGVVLHQIQDVGLAVEYDSQSSRRAFLQRCQIEIIAARLRGNLKIGASIGGDVHPGDLGDGGRKRHSRHAVVLFDIDFVDFPLRQHILLKLVHLPNLPFRAFPGRTEHRPAKGKQESESAEHVTSQHHVLPLLSD